MSDQAQDHGLRLLDDISDRLGDIRLALTSARTERSDVLRRLAGAEAERDRLRILLAWSNGTLLAHEAEEMLGVGRGELWAMEREEKERMKEGKA